jgi:serine/threonine-protein kinase
MPFPDLAVDEIRHAIPEAENVGYLARGGQKVVFACTINGQPFVLKFLRPQPRPLDGHENEASLVAPSIDDVTARARREVETMKQCDSPFLVKIGPIEIRNVKIADLDLLCFSEEFIDGMTGTQLLLPEHELIPIPDVIALGLDISKAIAALWDHRKIHRDIKPGNIMRRRSNGHFVLLDMGLVFDLDDESWSLGPVGTQVYFSPEQMEFADRRQVLDFRSDLFSLGVTMYQLATRVHPFVAGAHSSWDVMNNIKHIHPIPPSQIRGEVPRPLSDIIMRLLGKHPALRYRRISMLQGALAAVNPREGDHAC